MPKKINLEKFLKLLPEEYRIPYQKGWIHNYAVEIDEIKKHYKFASNITITDTTCRDGEQQVGVVFTPEQKVDIVQLLGEVGIAAAEIGYPGVSKEEERACKLITENAPKTMCFVMARANKNDIDAAIRSDARMLDLFTSCSEFHIRTKLGITPEENITKYLELLDYALDHGFGIIFGMEDISRSDVDYYVKIVKAVKEACGNKWAGTGISDTVGIFNPLSAKWFFRTVQDRLEGMSLAMHFHNDHGLATANTLACLEEGAAAISGTILGIGERCGNTAIEEIVVALRTLYGIKLRIKYDKLVELCDLVAKYAGIPIHVNKPIVGMNAFRHESGIHAHGVLSHPHIYEMIPHSLLNRKSEFAFGKFSGTAVVLEEVLTPHGIKPNKQQLREITLRVKDMQEQREAEKAKIKEEFVQNYYNTIRRMALTLDEVLEVANQVMNK
ncbi:MAG: LeuA family protein [Candidatus Helarchaeota archaeon]